MFYIINFFINNILNYEFYFHTKNDLTFDNIINAIEKAIEETITKRAKNALIDIKKALEEKKKEGELPVIKEDDYYFENDELDIEVYIDNISDRIHRFN
jgi:hypothetical protein